VPAAQADGVDAAVGRLPGRRQVGADGGDRQHPAAAGDDGAAAAVGRAGVQHLDPLGREPTTTSSPAVGVPG
jgi:hypothetical protein